MKSARSPEVSSALFCSRCSVVMMFRCQPVSSEARRTFCPPLPMASASWSSSTTTSIEWRSSSTTMELTSAGASALITNCAGVRRPQDDVDALAGELLGDRLHARAAHADAGADRVDARIVGLHRDLGAQARVARGGLDLEQAFLDLRHLELEELHQELRGHARQDELRAARLAIDLGDERAHAVAHAQVFLRDQLVARQQRLDAARFHDQVAALGALHGAGHERLAALEEVVEDLLALGVADLLQDHLLGGLRADAPEGLGLERLLVHVAHLRLGILGERRR